MKLNKNSWHAWLYRNSYKELPDSLCPYFWKLLIVLLLLPFTYIGYIIPDIRKEKSISLNALITFATVFVMYTSYVVGDYALEPTSLLMEVASFVLGLLCVATSAGTILGICALILYIKDKCEDYMYDKRYGKHNKKEYIVVEWWKGFTGKYCPRINWE